MRVFEALGEAMQTVGLWFLSLPCLVVGHKWEPQYYDYAEVNIVESHFCRRCWKVEYMTYGKGKS